MPPPQVSSDLVSTPLSTGRVSANSSAQSFSAAPTEVTELPTTTSVIQQREGIRPMPRSHSDPHFNDPYASLPRSASANSNHRRNNSHSSISPTQTLNTQAPSCAHLNPAASPTIMKKGPSGGLPGNQVGSGGERRPVQVGKPTGEPRGPHRVRIRPVTPSIDGQEVPETANEEENSTFPALPLRSLPPTIRHAAQAHNKEHHVTAPCKMHTAAFLPVCEDSVEPPERNMQRVCAFVPFFLFCTHVHS